MGREDLVRSRTRTAERAEPAGRADSRKPARRTARAGEPAAGQVKPVASAFRILRYLNKIDEPVRSAQVARELNLNNSTCFNILRTMAADGIIDFDPEAKTYSIGLGLVKLVDCTTADAKRIAVARPTLARVAKEFGVTATLWRRVFPNRIVLAGVEHSRNEMRIHMGEGQRLPEMMGATGRLVAAGSGMSRDEMLAAYKELRWARPISFEAYMREVRLAAKRGWAVDDGHFSQGVLAVAAPISSHEGRVEFSISAVMFRGQFDDKGVEKMGETLKKYGDDLARQLF